MLSEVEYESGDSLQVCADVNGDEGETDFMDTLIESHPPSAEENVSDNEEADICPPPAVKNFKEAVKHWRMSRSFSRDVDV